MKTLRNSTSRFVGALMAGWMLAVASLVAASTANAAQNQKIKLVPVGAPFHVQRSLTMGRGASLAFDLAAYEKTKTLSRCVLTNFTLESGRAVDLDLQQFTVFDRQTQFVAGTPGRLPRSGQAGLRHP